MLKIYNSLSRRKEKFTPIEKNRIRMYVCGMTVYDYCHLGHARVMVAFDSIIRYLRYSGYEVEYVRNITDIDDKIVNRANELGESYDALTERYIDYMREDLAALSIVKPDKEPRATDFIPEIIEMISRLIAQGCAYKTPCGDVYYRTRMFTDYGKLSGKCLDELHAGARVEPSEEKDDPLDFVLWKSSKPNEPSWESPWGAGRPGWHIECSAMSTQLLGNHFDIHGGGADLLFPHHENEIAQSEAANREKFVNVWMHNGYLQVNAEKMSKSLKNYLTIREILKKDIDKGRIGEILRFAFLTSHYRSPLNYSDDSLENSKSALRRLYSALQKAEQADTLGLNDVVDSQFISQFKSAMDDDFSTPDALAVMFECVRDLNRAVDAQKSERVAELKNALAEITRVLGIAQLPPRRFLGMDNNSDFNGAIREQVERRRNARKEHQWAIADQIRNELLELGVEIEDQPDGSTVWRKL